MADLKQNTLLVAIDGSDRSIRTVAYLAEMPAFFNKEIHLFNVFASIPESYYDLGKEPSSIKITSGLYAWEKEHRNKIEKHMNKCKKILVAADCNPEKVKIIIHKRRKGVAQDIISESKKGYEAVVVRRRGMSNLQGLIMGSVALKLLNGVVTTPLLFAGRKPCNRRILVAVDGSENALRAVDFVGRMVGGYDYCIGLVTVLRQNIKQNTKNGTDMDMEQAFMDAVELQSIQNIEKAREHLIAAGVEDTVITTEIVKGETSRAGGIIDTAEKGDFDTIVVGRRGLSRVQQFFAGRVSTKVLHVGRKHHVWIVN